jgi:chlorobactene glucosyltransferase
MHLGIVILSSVALLAGLLLTYWLHSQHHMDIVVKERLPRKDEIYPPITVIVPARNEARNISRCIQALLSQTYPNFELLVLDDRSTDDTPKILDDLQTQFQVPGSHKAPHSFRILMGIDLPPGWAGKPHALHQAAQQAQGEWLCFIDADTFLYHHCLTSVYETAVEEQADLFSILTDQELGSFWEKVILPLVFIGLSFGFPAKRVNDMTKPDAIANGQFILIRRSVYEATGGHAAVRNRIDEDKALAETVKRAGYRLVLADGRQSAATRMYTNLPEMWEGWTKNIFLGLRDRLWLLVFGAFAGLLGALLLPVWLLGGVLWLVVSGSTTAAVVAVQGLILWGYLLYQRRLASKAFNIHLAYSLTLPLGALIFTSMMFASTYMVLSRKGVRWRGRVYQG